MYYSIKNFNFVPLQRLKNQRLLAMGLYEAKTSYIAELNFHSLNWSYSTCSLKNPKVFIF